MSYLNSNEGFYLIYDEVEFQSVFYDCYAAFIKKAPFLKNQTEMLYGFIREYHNRETLRNKNLIPPISDDITRWLQDTLEKYNVSIAAAIERYLCYFYARPEIWPPRSRIKSKYSFREYDYNYKVKIIYSISTNFLLNMQINLL